MGGGRRERMHARGRQDGDVSVSGRAENSVGWVDGGVVGRQKVDQKPVFGVGYNL